MSKEIVANKTKINKTSAVKKAATATEVAAWPAVEKPTMTRLRWIELIKRLDGVKKFKELAEAMSATETDAMP